MKIESIAYEEQYINLEDPSIVNTVDSYLIKSSGEILRKLNGEDTEVFEARREDFIELEKEIIDFIDAADHTTYFIDNMKVSIVITFEDGNRQKLERGLACGDYFLDSIIEDYLDGFTEINSDEECCIDIC